MTFQRDIKHHRKLLHKLQNKHSSFPKNVVRCTHEIAFPENKKNVNMTIYQYQSKSCHKKNTNLWPTILFIPGTAFVGREMAYTDVICAKLAKYSKCQVLLLSHRLAPEYKFPTQYNDMSNLINKLLLHHKKYNINKDKIILVGYSTGGTLAASVITKFSSNIKKLILISPLLDLSRSGKKYQNCERKNKCLPKGFTEWFLDLYIPATINRKNPKLSPLWARNLHLYPPTNIVFGSRDVYRGDSEIFIKKLIDNGIKTQRTMFLFSDHSLLWVNNAAVKKVAFIAKKTFKPLFVSRCMGNLTKFLLNWFNSLTLRNYISFKHV
jgi:acetyl esterase/lipase